MQRIGGSILVALGARLAFGDRQAQALSINGKEGDNGFAGLRYELLPWIQGGSSSISETAGNRRKDPQPSVAQSGMYGTVRFSGRLFRPAFG
ncbi:hypothetical protein, partial [Ralstonia solanacearum]|uniref:hypothetical protein n=1 Tax=Ralstonia solanacearum TaxID=305 RepID=UPI0018D00C2E